jgi:hypothetical protein
MARHHPVAHIDQCPVFLQVPIAGAGPVLMLNDNIIAIRAVFRVPPAAIAIFFYPYHYTAPGCAHLCSPFHFKVNGYPVAVRKSAVIALYDQMRFAVLKGKQVNKAAVFLYPAPLKILYMALPGILRCNTSKEKGDEKNQDQSQAAVFFE